MMPDIIELGQKSSRSGFWICASFLPLSIRFAPVLAFILLQSPHTDVTHPNALPRHLSTILLGVPGVLSVPFLFGGGLDTRGAGGGGQGVDRAGSSWATRAWVWLGCIVVVGVFAAYAAVVGRVGR